MKTKIENIFNEFGVRVSVIDKHVGPTLTTYEIKLGKGVRLNKVLGYESDLALLLGAESIRYQVPFKNTSNIGIEVPNSQRDMVKFGDLLKGTSKLEFVVGKDMFGEAVTIDLAKLPHLMVAGQTGSGKSVALNCLITSLLRNNTPDDLNLVLIDPKKVEFIGFNNYPHVIEGVIDDLDESVAMLRWLCEEMELRYKVLQAHGVRNLDSLEKRGHKLSRIVVVIDELADLMLQAKNDVEPPLVRLAAKARAAGIHLVLATQRPSVNVITGVLKANIPARMAFKVASLVDSKVIMDSKGAESLLGQGDMLYVSPSDSTPRRIQGAFIED